MTNLYDIGEDLASIAESIQQLLEDGADPTSNQVQELLNEMIGADDEWRGKAIRCAFYIKNTLADVKAIDDELKRLNAKKAKSLKSAMYLEGLLIKQMERFDLCEIKSSTLTLRLRKTPPSVVVIDEDKIPMEFKRMKYEIDKTAIKQAGGVDGAQLTTRNTLKYL